MQFTYRNPARSSDPKTTLPQADTLFVGVLAVAAPDSSADGQANRRAKPQTELQTKQQADLTPKPQGQVANEIIISASQWATDIACSPKLFSKTHYIPPRVDIQRFKPFTVSQAEQRKLVEHDKTGLVVSTTGSLSQRLLEKPSLNLEPSPVKPTLSMEPNLVLMPLGLISMPP